MKAYPPEWIEFAKTVKNAVSRGPAKGLVDLISRYATPATMPIWRDFKDRFHAGDDCLMAPARH